MFKKITSQMDKLASKSILLHTALTAAVFVGFNLVKNQLDASYAASNHPVDYATGQTTFSAEAIRGFYAHMQDLGTLHIYVKTQIIDFGFIAMMMLMGFFVGALVSRVGPAEGYGRKIGILAGLSVICGAVFDIIENLLSFKMLANPTNFADFIALPYSAAAVSKFALIALGLLLVNLSLVVGLYERIASRFQKTVGV